MGAGGGHCGLVAAAAGRGDWDRAHCRDEFSGRGAGAVANHGIVAADHGRGPGHRLLAGDDAVTLRPLGDDPVADGAGVQVHRGVSLEWLVYVGVLAVDAGVVGVFDLVAVVYWM